MPDKTNLARIIIILAANVINPTLNASVLCLPAVSSPNTAPINNPSIIPHGGKKKTPINIPTTEPQIPYFEAL